jgi:thioredoxin 1
MEANMVEVASVNQENFETEVVQAPRPVIVEFWTEGCKPCQALGRAIRRYTDRVKIASCNVDENQELCSAYGVRVIPSLLFFKNGQLVDEANGYINNISEAEVTAKVEKLLAGP